MHVGALHDQSPTVRESAAAAFAKLGDPSALPALKQGLKNRDEDEWVRLRMGQAVAGLGDSDGIPILLDLAKDGDAKVTRLEALSTLSKLAALPDSPPGEPDSPEGTALIQTLNLWWRRDGARLKWDAASHTYHRGR